MKKWFWNPNEDRLRAVWRILLQVGILLGLLMGVYQAGVFEPGKLRLARIEFSLLGIALVVVSLAARFLDRRPFSDLGIHLRRGAWWADYGFGALSGLLQAILFARMLVGLGWITVEPVFKSIAVGISLVPAVLIDIATFVSVGVLEELIRAYQVRNTAEGLIHRLMNWRLALLGGVVAASLFSMGMHLNQQGPIFWIFVFFNSIFYCLYYLLTGRIALAMGMHFAWDFCLSTIVSLGGASGANAAVLLAAPMTSAGRLPTTLLWMSLLALALDIAALPLIVLYIRQHYGVVRIRRELTVYTVKDRQPECSTLASPGVTETATAVSE